MLTKSHLFIKGEKLCLLSIEHIIRKSEINLLNDLREFGLLDRDIDLRNRDSKGLIYHHIIHLLCDTVIKLKDRYNCDVVVVYDDITNKTKELCGYVNCDKFRTQLERLFKQIEKNLFIPFVKNHDSINEAFLHTGEGIDLINTIIIKQATCASRKNQNLHLAKKFCSKNGLTFINEQYLAKITTAFNLLK